MYVTRGSDTADLTTTARTLVAGYLVWSTTAWWGWITHTYDRYPVIIWVWAGEGIVLIAVTAWLVRVQSRILAIRKQPRRTGPTGGPGQPPHDRWVSPIAPSGGPLHPRLIGPDGVHIDLVVLPKQYASADGWNVWLAFGPEGEPVPMGCEMVFEHLPQRTIVIVQTEEDADGRQVFMATPTAMHTPN